VVGFPAFVKSAGNLRGDCLLVACKGESVCVFPRDVVVFRDPLGCQPHRQQRGRIVLGQPRIGPWLDSAHWQHAHGFCTARNHHPLHAASDAHVGLRNGFKAGGTEPVHCHAGHVGGKLSSKRCHARHVPALLALLLRATKDHVFDFGSIQATDSFQSIAHGKCGQIVGACGG
jgi:hypothetical protein